MIAAVASRRAVALLAARAPAAALLGSRAPSSATARSLSSAAFAKRTTGVVGLEVQSDARWQLMELYSKALRDVRALLPEGAAYRRAVEQSAGARLDVVRACADVAEIEARIGRGQVEELVAQAKAELQLIPQYAAWRMHEAKPPAKEDDVGHDDLYTSGQFSDAELGGELRPLALAKQRELQERESARAKAEAEAAAAKAKAAADAAAAAAKAAAAAAAPAPAPGGAAAPKKA